MSVGAIFFVFFTDKRRKGKQNFDNSTFACAAQTVKRKENR